MDDGTPVTEDYKEDNNKFTGRIYKVTIELKETKTAGGDEMKQAMQDASKRKTMAD